MAAPVLVQHVGGTAVSGTTGVYTVTATGTAAGTGLAIIVGWRIAAAASQTITSITDNKGNTWAAENIDNDATSTQKADIWSVNPSVYISGVTTITVHFSIAASSNFDFYELSGGDMGGAWGDIGGSNHASSTAPTTSTPALAGATEYVIAGIAWASSTVTISGITAGWTTETLQTTAGAPNQRLQSAHQTTAATTALTYAGTLSVATRWSAVVCPFKGSTGVAVALTSTMAATGAMTDTPNTAVAVAITDAATGAMTAAQSVAVALLDTMAGSGALNATPQLLVASTMSGAGAMAGTLTQLQAAALTVTMAGLGALTAGAGADFPGARCTHTIATLVASAVPSPATAPVPVLSAAAVGVPMAQTVPVLMASTVPC